MVPNLIGRVRKVRLTKDNMSDSSIDQAMMDEAIRVMGGLGDEMTVPSRDRHVRSKNI